jgi:hypothetical protein
MDPNYIHDTDDNDDDDNENNATNDEESASLLEYSDTSLEFSSRGGAGGKQDEYECENKCEYCCCLPAAAAAAAASDIHPQPVSKRVPFA